MKPIILFKDRIYLSALIYLAALIVVLYLGLALSITLSSERSYHQADSAIVLGAAVWGKVPSPVFKSRIDYAISLYQQGSIHHIYFTGGQGNADELTEGEMARQYALSKGIPEDAISTETTSHTTFDNIKNIYPQIRKDETVLIISDPLHVPRGLRMARSLGIDAYPAPTPFTLYRSLHTNLKLLKEEIYFTVVYWIYHI